MRRSPANSTNRSLAAFGKLQHILLARSTNDIAWPCHRVGADSCSMFQTPRPGISFASHRGHTSGSLPDDSPGVVFENRTP